MTILNKWETDKIIHKSKILEFDFLFDNDFITEIEDDYFYLNTPIYDVEKKYYDDMNKELMEKLGIDSLESGLKTLIKKVNKYNEIKDIAQVLIGKIADLRGVSLKEIYEELDISDDD